MTTEKLIIDGVDHAKFDLEWVKKGGVAYGVTQAGTYTLWTYFQGRFAFLALRYQHCDWAIETMGDAKYPFNLLLSVITVSLETLDIVKALPKLDIYKDALERKLRQKEIFS